LQATKKDNEEEDAAEVEIQKWFDDAEEIVTVNLDGDMGSFTVSSYAFPASRRPMISVSRCQSKGHPILPHWIGPQALGEPINQ
jgi:hypothetical protein